MQMIKNPTVKQATICVFVSSLFYSFGGLFFKILPYHTMATNSGRSILAAAVIFVFCKLTGIKFKINRTIFFGGICICLMNTLFAIANKLTAAGNAIILQFTAPIYVLVISYILWKKKPLKRDIWASLAVLGGMIVFFIDSLSAGNALGNLLAIISGVAMAAVFMINTSKNADPMTSVLIGALFNFVIGLPWLVKTDFPSYGTMPFIYLLMFGILDLGMGNVIMSIGLKNIPAIRACLIQGFEPVLNPMIVALLYHEMLTPLALLGAVIVFVAIFIYNYLNAKDPEKSD